MGTYHNGYSILSDVREDLHVHSTALVQGTETHSPYSNAQILRKINNAQDFIYSLLIKRIKGQFLESVDLTGVDSVFTLPWNFGYLREFKNEDGYKVFPIDIDSLPLNSGTGSDRKYYRKGNTLVLTESGVTETYTLWYYKKPRELNQGMSSAGGALSLTLASTAKAIADYYNNMIIENVTDDWTDTISDYTAARVATITETGAASKYYGIVSELPEVFHPLIAPKAVLSLKLMPISKQKPTVAEKAEWEEMLLEALRSFAGEAEDLPSVWGSGGLGYEGVEIPDQGYTIF